MATVKDIMSKKIVAINKDESLRVVCKMLVTKKLSGIPVIDDKNKLIGFISERDIIAAAGSSDNFQKKRISEVMTKKVLAVEVDTPVENVSRLFTDKPFRYIPVTKGGRIVGTVSRKDVINKLLGQYY